MRKILYTLVFSLSLLIVKSQSWQQLGGGLSYQSRLTSVSEPFPQNISAKVHDGKLYAAYTEWSGSSGNYSRKVVVEVWNGISWAQLPVMPSNEFHAHDIEVLNDTIYLVGTDYGAGGNTILFRYDGTSWSGLSAPNFSGTAYGLSQFQGELIITGAFSITFVGDHLVKFKNGSFLPMGGIGGTASLSHVNNTAILNNELYAAAGSFIDFSQCIWKYDQPNDTWVKQANFLRGAADAFNSMQVYTYNNSIFAVENRQTHFQFSAVFEVANDSLKYIGAVQHHVSDFEILDGKAYFVGDTLGNDYKSITIFDGNNLTPILNTPFALSAVEAMDSSLVVFSPLLDPHSGVDYNHVFKSGLDSLASINGRVFVDTDSNCVYNTMETFLPHVICSIAGSSVSSDSRGVFSVALPAGSYSLDTLFSPVVIAKNMEVNCALPTNITLLAGQSVRHDIGMSNNIPVDGVVSLTPYRGFSARHGFKESYRLDFSNAGNTLVSQATVQVELPTSITYVSGTPAPSVINGNILTYNFFNVAADSLRSANIEIEVNTNTNSIGDTLNFLASISSGLNGDADLSDNADTVQQVITAAVDPNDKQASAETILPGTKRIDYHIRFQNTGNDTAVKVTVVDTLDMTLPLTSIRIKSASHPYQLRVEGNVLIWEFENIMLPDSATDESGSQGFVRFSAGINQTLKVGDTIYNDAEIYFDYQPPVHTNFAKTALIKRIGLKELKNQKAQVKIYPNPATAFFNIQNLTNQSVDLKLFNINGKYIESIFLNKEEHFKYNVNKLPEGIYFLREKGSIHKILVQ